ncbi:MAG: hypothetical protein ACHQUC_01630 [Chlamydiales bacterium]
MTFYDLHFENRYYMTNADHERFLAKAVMQDHNEGLGVDEYGAFLGRVNEVLGRAFCTSDAAGGRIYLNKYSFCRFVVISKTAATEVQTHQPSGLSRSEVQTEKDELFFATVKRINDNNECDPHLIEMCMSRFPNNTSSIPALVSALFGVISSVGD